ncbi:MaoC family dehydratase [Solimonas soli]|uniref:MaoC family dehydratase n=1 Tax=Solimonas soli TaxID=413479 RepID=UPI000488B263|nr:MaoC family dehydratase [Solimonas soli]
MSATAEPTPLGQGFYWQDIHAGQRFRTIRRTVTETDLVNFISVTGMLEAIFIDAEFEGAAMSGRAVPAALTQGLIEGLLFQTMIQGTGLALLEMSLKALKPVRVGDTIWAIVTITDVKPTSKGNRAVVTSEIEVHNTRGEQVLVYTAKRMLAGRP